MDISYQEPKREILGSRYSAYRYASRRPSESPRRWRRDAGEPKLQRGGRGVPLPDWAYVLLSLGLMAAMWRQRRVS
jgi:hypothetical protein